eukprot:568761-Rhodomonas_salina.2
MSEIRATGEKHEAADREPGGEPYTGTIGSVECGERNGDECGGRVARIAQSSHRFHCSIVLFAVINMKLPSLPQLPQPLPSPLWEAGAPPGPGFFGWIRQIMMC